MRSWSTTRTPCPGGPPARNARRPATAGLTQQRRARDGGCRSSRFEVARRVHRSRCRPVGGQRRTGRRRGSRPRIVVKAGAPNGQELEHICRLDGRVAGPTQPPKSVKWPASGTGRILGESVDSRLTIPDDFQARPAIEQGLEPVVRGAPATPTNRGRHSALPVRRRLPAHLVPRWRRHPPRRLGVLST